MRDPVSAAAAEAARVGFVRYCGAQGWDCWGLWLAMGYDDDWLGSHCPLGLLAMLTSRLSLGERRRPAWCLWADLDDWRFGDLSLLSVPTSSLARLDQAYAPPKPPAPGAPQPASA